MEIKENYPNENKQRQFILRAYSSKGVSLGHLCFGTDPKTGRQAGKRSSRKREGFMCVLIGGCRLGEVVGGLIRSGVSWRGW